MKKIVLFVFIIFFALAIILIVNSNNNIVAKNKKSNDIKIEKKIEEKEPAKIKVDIKGFVANPGVYEADINSRVIDVINLSGGLIDGADTDGINLSKIIKDEDVIIIYSINDYEKTKEVYDKKINYCKEDINDSCINDIANENQNINSDISSETININTASVDDLIKLPGIGEAKAQNIIDYRNDNGQFNSIDEIKNISGIGESIFEKIKEYINV